MRGTKGQSRRGHFLGAATLAAASLICADSAISAQGSQPAPVQIAIPNASFEEGVVGRPPPGWHGSISPSSGDVASAADFASSVDDENPRDGRASVRLESNSPTRDQQQFGTVTGTIEAAPLRGRRIRLTGAVRADVPAATHVGLWLRVDRSDRRPGFFDNMSGRSIRSTSWADYSIEGDVAPDAQRLVFGLLLAGPGRAWLDNVRLEDIGPARSAGAGQPGPVQRPRAEVVAADEPARALTAQGMRNLAAFAELYGIVRYFHPSDEAAAADWDGIAMIGVEQVESARTPAELAARLRSLFRPLGSSIEIFAAGSPPRAGAQALVRPAGSAGAVRWRHAGLGEHGNLGPYSSSRIDAEAISAEDVIDVSLKGGVSARVPLVLWRDAQGRTLPPGEGALPLGRKPAGFVPAGFDRATRLAAVVEAWAALQHGYPYFDVVAVDWERQLGTTLRAAAVDPDDWAFGRTLRRMIAALQDGHGNVGYANPHTGVLPVAWEEVEGRLVITGVAKGVEGLSRGDTVTHIGGRSVAGVMAELLPTYSGSRQWTRHRARAEALMGQAGDKVELGLSGGDGVTRKAVLVYRPLRTDSFVRAVKPEPIAQLAPGILYVDLDRATNEAIEARASDLAAARGIVFDLRGYPRSRPDFLRHIARGPFQSAHFEVPIYLRPNRQGVTFHEGGWNMTPETPSWTQNVAFITDGCAISYAESILGLVRANKFGDIVGEATAGANGNVTTQQLPGGYRVAWTGMRVRNRDGSQHHTLGVQPTVPVSPTLAGVRAGRDEMLERALALVQSRAAADPAVRH